MKILVFGGWGQLGSDLVRVAEGRHEIVRPRHAEVAVEDADAVSDVLEDVRPVAVLNAAAFHKVELCESDPARAYATNAQGARNVASASARARVRGLFVSTDYVFDGRKADGYTEDDPVSPISAYGLSKAAGERAVLESGSLNSVVRASGLFGHAGSSGKGGNFVETMLAKAERGEAISVVDDQVFSPTATYDLAGRILALIEREVPAGVYHATNAGRCSWYELARQAVRSAGFDVEVVPTRTDPNAPVRRPPFSVLVDTKGPTLGLPPMRAWQDALAWYLQERQRAPSRLAATA